jgi:hypothetical protein
MDIPNVERAEGKAAAPQPAGQDRVRELCGEFEGMLLGILLKEGLVPQQEADGEEAPGSGLMMESTVEQTARVLGLAGTVGLGEALYREISIRAGGGAATPAKAGHEQEQAPWTA